MQPTILIVDDDPAGRETLESLLIRFGYRLEFAVDGSEAISKATDLSPDLILLDVMMPGMDGFEVCRCLRNHPVLSEVPIIMVTALDDQQSRIEGLEAGADDFISKPFNRAELRARIRTITRLNRYRRLLEERARFEWVIEHAQDGFLLVNTQDIICYANKQASAYLHVPYPLTEAENVPFYSTASTHYLCQPDESWASWQNDICSCNISDAPTMIRYLVRPESQGMQTLWLQVDMINVTIGTLPERLVRLRDRTEQITRQRQIWTFHSLLSHKLNTPLSGLMNSLYMLRQESNDCTPESVKEFSTIAIKSVERLHKQLSDIRRYLRMSELTASGDTCDAATFQHIISQMSQEMELPSVLLEQCELLNDAHFVLTPQAIELIFRQVLENSHKFHPQHSPTITISVSTVTETEATIRICDDGVSLTPEQISSVWLPYYQAEKNFSGEVPGMGLGLAIVAGLLWSVGGRYSLANRMVPGVEVTLTIPLLHDAKEDEEWTASS